MPIIMDMTCTSICTIVVFTNTMHAYMVCVCICVCELFAMVSPSYACK